MCVKDFKPPKSVDVTPGSGEVKFKDVLAELKTGRSPQMRKLAEDIIAAQKHEIAIFEIFLADKRHPVDKKKK